MHKTITRIFRSKEGKIVIAQWPNLPLIVWAVALAAKQLPLNATFAELADLIQFGAIFTWAWMEIFQGVNLFRRGLGIVVMAAILHFRILG